MIWFEIQTLRLKWSSYVETLPGMLEKNARLMWENGRMEGIFEFGAGRAIKIPLLSSQLLLCRIIESWELRAELIRNSWRGSPTLVEESI